MGPNDKYAMRVPQFSGGEGLGGLLGRPTFSPAGQEMKQRDIGLFDTYYKQFMQLPSDQLAQIGRELSHAAQNSNSTGPELQAAMQAYQAAQQAKWPDMTRGLLSR